MSTEKQAGRGLCYFLAHLVPVVDPIPGLEWIFLLEVKQDGTVHLLHSFLYVLVDLYSTTRSLFACQGELPNKGTPLVVELPIEVLAVRRYVCAVPRADHISHLGGVSPLDGQAMPFE